MGLQAQLVANALQVSGLCRSIDNIADDAPAQMAIDHFELVGKSVVKAQALLQARGEIGEAARHQHGVQASALQTLHQAFGAGVQLQAVGVDFFQGLLGQAGEQ